MFMSSLLEQIMRSKAQARKFSQGKWKKFIKYLWNYQLRIENNYELWMNKYEWIFEVLKIFYILVKNLIFDIIDF